MLRILGRMRFSVAQRNFFPVPPRYPEPDELTYRPRITTLEDQATQHEKVYRRKLHKIKERVKSHVMEIAKTTIPRPEKQKVKLGDQMEQILSEVYFDPETGLPAGLFFDDFIMDIKASKGSQSGQRQEAEYTKKVNLLVDKLRYMNASQRKQYAIELLTKTEAPQHIKEARKQIYDRILGAIQKLPTKEREQYSEEKIENMIDPKVVDVVSAQLAREKISKNLKHQDITFPAQAPKLYEEVSRKLGFYESPVTDEGESDDERLLNMRYARPSDGQEALQTQQSIRDKVNMDFIKRAYLNKLDKQERYLNSPEDNLEQYDDNDRLIVKTDQEKLMSYFDRVTQEGAEIDFAAQSINKKIEEKATFDTIVDCIDHLLLDAPQFIKNMYYDKNNKHKPYESRFQDVESQVSLLWKDFDDTFPVIFPEIKKQPEQQDEEELEKEVKIKPYGEKMKEMMVNDDFDEEELYQQQIEKLEQEIYPLELYKEMLQPTNAQFFHHYLTNTFRLNHEQINDGLSSYHYDLNPYTYQVPDTAMMYDDADQDFDDKQAEIEEFKIEDNRNIQVHELVQKDYNEASLLTYVGRGKRKSSICYVQIKKGTGDVTINGKNLINYFPHPYFRRTAIRVLEIVQLSCLVDVEVLIKGGSQSAQSQCICSGLSRAIVKMCPSAKGLFRKLQLTLTDNRKVERKKIGLYKARKKYPYSRR